MHEDLKFRDEVIERLVRMETMLASIVGNGQPGRLGRVEQDVQQLWRFKNVAYGMILGISGLVSVAAELLYRVFKH